MTAFVIASVVLAVLALGYVLQPLWRNRPVAGAVLTALVAVAGGLLYAGIGTPRALDPAERKAPDSLAQAVTQLEAELERDPNQVEGWRLLGGAYLSEGRLDAAVDAYARALALAPEDPGLLTEAAETRAMARDDRRFDAEAVAMLERALAIQPQHQRARWFLGIAHRQAGRPADAVRLWEPLLASVDAATAGSLRPQINQARAEAGMAPLSDPAADQGAPGVSITISVSLDPMLAMQYPDGASVFVIARQANGAPMPVAVRKLASAAFPLKVTLTDADSLMPTTKLSQLDQVQLTARVSPSGDASARPGDFESAPVLVETGEDAAAVLLIDKVVK